MLRPYNLSWTERFMLLHGWLVKIPSLNLWLSGMLGYFLTIYTGKMGK